MRSTYEDHRVRAEGDYAELFSTWWGTLSPAQITRLQASGINGPEVEGRSSGTALERDAAEIPRASYRVDLAQEVDTLADEFAEKFELPQEVALPLAAWSVREIERRSLQYKSALLTKLCGGLIDGKNPKLMAAGLAFAANLAALNGLGTQREYAKRIHVTPAALSKVTKMWQVFLEITTSVHMKTNASCGAYSCVQSSDRHWRRQKAHDKAIAQLASRYKPAEQPVFTVV